MDIKQILYFMEIVKKGSYTKAAESLALTQPALSKQIQLLDRELEVSLFDRTGRKISVTTAGEILFQKSVRLYDEYRNVLNTDFNTGKFRGQYIISTGSTIAGWILPEILLNIRKNYNNVSFKVIEGDAVQTRDSLLKGESDIGILSSYIKLPELGKNYFFSDTIVPVISENYFLAEKNPVTIEDLNNIPFVMFHPASSIRQTIQKKISKLKPVFHPEIVMESRSVESVIRSISAGLGAGFLSEISIQKPLVKLPFTDLTIKRDFYFYYRKSRFDGLSWIIEEMSKFR